MPNYRQFNQKLASLRSMKRVTEAMKMVSATKLRRAQQAQSRAGRFLQELRGVASIISSARGFEEHPLLTPRAEVRNTLLVLMTSDKGLCGAFNNNVIKLADRWVREHKPKVETFRMSFCGRRGFLAFRKRVEVRSFYENATARPRFAEAANIGNDVLESFMGQKYDEVYLAYNIYKSPLSQTPTVERLLPFQLEPMAGAANTDRYLLEPRGPELLQKLLERLVFNRIFSALLDNAAGEHGARMTAMDAASRNIDELRTRYTLIRNRVRQAAITKELIEIISGAEALKS